MPGHGIKRRRIIEVQETPTCSGDPRGSLGAFRARLPCSCGRCERCPRVGKLGRSPQWAEVLRVETAGMRRLPPLLQPRRGLRGSAHLSGAGTHRIPRRLHDGISGRESRCGCDLETSHGDGGVRMRDGECHRRSQAQLPGTKRDSLESNHEGAANA